MIEIWEKGKGFNQEQKRKKEKCREDEKKKRVVVEVSIGPSLPYLLVVCHVFNGGIGVGYAENSSFVMPWSRKWWGKRCGRHGRERGTRRFTRQLITLFSALEKASTFRCFGHGFQHFIGIYWCEM